MFAGLVGWRRRGLDPPPRSVDGGSIGRFASDWGRRSRVFAARQRLRHTQATKGPELLSGTLESAPLRVNQSDVKRWQWVASRLLRAVVFRGPLSGIPEPPRPPQRASARPSGSPGNQAMMSIVVRSGRFRPPRARKAGARVAASQACSASAACLACMALARLGRTRRQVPRPCRAGWRSRGARSSPAAPGSRPAGPCRCRKCARCAAAANPPAAAAASRCGRRRRLR